MRLIDADALHKSIDTETYRHTYIEQIHEIIDKAPTLQVFRCKKCKNRHTLDCPMLDETQDDEFCYMWQKEGARNEID